MDIMDILLITLAFLSLIITLNKHKMNKKFLTYFTIIFSFLLIFYSTFGNTKWQLFPLILYMLLLLGYDVLKSPKKLYKILFATLSVIFLLASTLLIYVFPTYDIPNPSGQYSIGTRYQIIEDDQRLELYTEDTTDTRKFVVRMWYPTDNILDKERSKWLGDTDISRELAKSIGLPFFALDQTADVLSNAYSFAPISDASDTYPVVIISHGWGGFMSLHTDLAEELASRGYFVISIDHTYGSVISQFIDENVLQNKDALPDRTDPGFLEAAHQLVYTYAGDVSRTLDYLEENNQLTSFSFFKGRLDLEHIGVIGHSTGGGADVAVALNDMRIDALLGLDAWVEPINQSEIEKGLTIPAMFLRSETWEEGPNNVNLYDLINRSPQAALYQINQTTHSDFTMAYMFSPLTSMIGFTGSLDSDYLIDMQKDIMNLFFDEHLKGVINQTIDLSTYDELIKIM